MKHMSGLVKCMYNVFPFVDHVKINTIVIKSISLQKTNLGYCFGHLSTQFWFILFLTQIALEHIFDDVLDMRSRKSFIWAQLIGVLHANWWPIIVMAWFIHKGYHTWINRPTTINVKLLPAWHLVQHEVNILFIQNINTTIAENNRSKHSFATWLLITIIIIIIIINSIFIICIISVKFGKAQ